MSELLNPVPFAPKVVQSDIGVQLQGLQVKTPARDIGDLLVERGQLTAANLKKIRALQKKTGKSFEKTALRMRAVRKEHLTTALATKFGYLRDDVSIGSLPKALPIISAPTSKAAEEYRKLRTMLLTENTPEALELFSIAPASSAVRVEELAANLATSFAILRKRVLLIDADLKRGRLRRFFDLPKQKGLFDVLDGSVDFPGGVCQSSIANLSVMTSGAPRHNAQELIASERVSEVFDCARSLFDMVIVVTPPVTTDADARFMWMASPRALVATRQNETRHHELQNLKSTFRQLDVASLGAVLMR